MPRLEWSHVQPSMPHNGCHAAEGFLVPRLEWSHVQPSMPHNGCHAAEGFLVPRLEWSHVQPSMPHNGCHAAEGFLVPRLEWSHVQPSMPHNGNAHRFMEGCVELLVLSIAGSALLAPVASHHIDPWWITLAIMLPKWLVILNNH